MPISVLKIKTTKDGPLEEFDSTRTYVIWDSYPVLTLQLTGEIAPNRSIQTATAVKWKLEFRGPTAARNGDPERIVIEARRATSGDVWEARLNEAWKSKRVFGLVTCALKQSNESIQLYIVPDQLVTMDQLKLMIQDIADELRREAAWRTIADGTLPTRAWVDEKRPFVSPFLISDFQAELLSAKEIRRRPPSDVDWVRTAKAPTGVVWHCPGPERAVVLHWARRRVRQINAELSCIEQEDRCIVNQSGLPRSPQGLKKLESRADDLRRRRASITECRTKLSPFLQEEALASPVDISPTSLRDPHIRRLMSAFGATAMGRFVDQSSRLSALPPELPSRVFELWGAVWLARQLRALGYELTLRSVGGLNVIGAVRWIATHEGTEINLYYEPNPPSLRGIGGVNHAVPAVQDRDESVEAWLLKRHQVDFDSRGLPPLYGTHDVCSPDYVLTVMHRNHRTLLVGEATMQDADFATSRRNDGEQSHIEEKMTKVDGYLRTVRWLLPGDEIVEAHPLGGFLLLPGSTADWDSVPRDHTNCEVTLIVPPIGTAAAAHDNGAAAARFAKLLGRHVKLPAV